MLLLRDAHTLAAEQSSAMFMLARSEIIMRLWQRFVEIADRISGIVLGLFGQPQAQPCVVVVRRAARTAYWVVPSQRDRF
jgi:hypothetical protein